MHVLLAGATGLVGSHTLQRLQDAGVTVTTVGRRASGRVPDEIVAAFDALPELPTSDVAICTLGTTIAAAGSREAFRAVDHDAVMAFARAARLAGVHHFIVVTAVGADAASGVFYSRVKGEVEAALQAIGFERLDILQPGLLLGPRQERRLVEGVFQKLAPIMNTLLIGGLNRYAAIEADTVAGACVALLGDLTGGVFRHENQAMRELAAAA